MDNPLDRQMAEIKDKADLLRWVDNLSPSVEGVILVQNPATGRITCRHLGDITKPRALWNLELYKIWLTTP